MKKCYVSCICALLFAIGTLNATIFDNNLDPDCTTLIAPEDGALDVFPNENLFWTPVADAAGYIVRMGTQSGSGDFLDDVVTTDAFLTIPTMENNTIYFVSITPFSLNDVADECLETTFQVGDQLSPECMSLSFPENGATNVSIFTSFSWETLDGALGYILSLGTTPYGREIVDNLDVGDVTSFSVNELDYSTTYYISVAPYGELGGAVGCDEEIFSTESIPVPACPIIELPNNNATDVDINTIISWLPVDDVDGYMISVGTTLGGTDIINQEIMENATSLNPNGLEYETTYYVSIVAFNDLGVSQNCGIFSFTTELEPNEIAVNCPTDLILQAPIGNTSMVVNWAEPTVITSCEDEEVTVTQVSGLPNGSMWPVGEAVTVKYEIADNCGNSTLCEFNVTIEGVDFELSIICSNDVGLTTDDPNGRVITLNEPEFETNCGISDANITQVVGPESGTLFPIGTSLVAFQIEVVCNGEVYTEFCEYNVILEFESDLIITCPGNQFIATNVGATTTIVSWDEPIVITLCEDLEYTLTQVSGLQNGSEWPVGQTSTVTYEVTDNCGNASSCSFNIEVDENLLDFTITCPDDIMMTTDNPNGMVVELGQVIANTNCNDTNSGIVQTGGLESGSIFPVGISVVTFEATIECEGQTFTESCSYNVIVELETTECIQELDGFVLLGEFENHNYFISTSTSTWTNASAIANSNNATLLSVNSAEENDFVKSQLGNNIVFIGLSENANGDYVWDSGEAFSYNFIETPAPNDAAIYANMNFWSGGWSFDSEFVERLFVIEITCGPPTPSLSVTCPEDQNISTENMESVIVTWNAPIASSTCPEETISIEQVAGPASGSSFEVGTTTTILYEISDACNNVETCAFTVTISNLPSSECPEMMDGLTLLGEYEGHKYFKSNAAATWLDAAAFAEDNGGYLVSINDAAENEFVRQNISEISFIGLSDFENEGTLTWDSGEPYTYTFLESLNQISEDFASINFWNGSWQLENNQVNKPFIVEFDCEETTPSLTISCSENLVIETADGATSIFLTWEIPSGTTTCEDSEIIVVQTRGPAFGSVLEAGENVNIGYSISDACGNTELCEFNIQVNAFEPNECPESLDDFTALGQFEQHNYFISNNAMSWEDAQEVAVELGGYLASITSPAENEFLRSNISEIAFIGLTDQNEEGEFEWVSGETYFSGNILDGNTDGDDFGTINFWNGGWGTVGPFVQKPFIIEIDCQIFPDGNERVGAKKAITIAKVFPNPSKELVTVEIESMETVSTKIRIFDVLGVFQKELTIDLVEGNNMVNIEIDALKNGIYFIEIAHENILISKKKFVKF